MGAGRPVTIVLRAIEIGGGVGGAGGFGLAVAARVAAAGAWVTLADADADAAADAAGESSDEGDVTGDAVEESTLWEAVGVGVARLEPQPATNNAASRTAPTELDTRPGETAAGCVFQALRRVMGQEYGLVVLDQLPARSAAHQAVTTLDLHKTGMPGYHLHRD